MRVLGFSAAMLGIGVLVLPFASPASAAKMTIEQARTACRGEIPLIRGGDAGGSRGNANPNRGRLRDCIRAKMGLRG